VILAGLHEHGGLVPQPVDEVPGAVEGGQEALGPGRAGTRELHQLDGGVRVAVGAVPGGERGVQLGPEQRRLLGVLGGDEREVLVHAQPEEDRAGEFARKVCGVGLGDARDADATGCAAALGGLLPERRERDHLAVAAHRALDQLGQPGELALHLVAPAGLRGLVVLAVVLADFAAEDVPGELAEVAAGDDGLVAGVDGVQLAAARSEEQEVRHEHRAGEDGLAALLVDRREPEGGGQVVAAQHLRQVVDRAGPRLEVDALGG
jgi:hypothetical protein